MDKDAISVRYWTRRRTSFNFIACLYRPGRNTWLSPDGGIAVLAPSRPLITGKIMLKIVILLLSSVIRNSICRRTRGELPRHEGIKIQSIGI
jgi:hypothetical protein